MAMQKDVGDGRCGEEVTSLSFWSGSRDWENTLKGVAAKILTQIFPHISEIAYIAIAILHLCIGSDNIAAYSTSKHGLRILNFRRFGN